MAYTHDSRDLTPAMTSNTAPSPITVSASSETYSPSFLAWQAFNHTGGNSTYATNTVPSVSVPQWLKIDFGSGNEQYVGAYAISEDTTNANSQPKDWTFEGSSNGTDWVVLDTRSNEVSANWSSGTLRYFNCQKSGLFRYYRINCTANCGATNVYCIAELELFDTRANLCQTMTSNTAPAPYAAFASSELSSYAAYLALDSSLSTLWASANSSPPHSLSYYCGGDKYIFTGVSINGTYASAGTQPKDFKIQGSNDNVTWDDLASYTNQTSWTNGLWKNFSCKCTKSYRFIRLYITANNGYGSGETDIYGLKVFGQLKDKCITPVMTAFNTPNPYLATATHSYSSPFDPSAPYNRTGYNAGSMGILYSSIGVGTYFTKIYLGGNLCKVTHVDICGINGAESYITSPKDFTIQGSIDDVAYTTLYTAVGVTWNTYEMKTFPVTVGYWKYIKVNVTASTNASASYAGLKQIIIYGEQYSNLCATMTSNSLPAPYSCSASSEYNSSYAAWCAFNKAVGDYAPWQVLSGSTGWLQYYFGGISYIFNAITILSTALGLNRNPKDFTIEVSNDGTNWLVVSTVTNQTGWQTSERRLFTFKTYSAYKYLRLNISSDNGGGYLGLNELEVYGTPAKQIITIFSSVTTYSHDANDLTPIAASSNGTRITASSEVSGYPAYRAFNHASPAGTDNAFWLVGWSIGCWLKYNFEAQQQINAYSISAHAWSSWGHVKGPKSWTLQGSNNNSNWTELHSVSNITWADNDMRYYYLPSTVNYQYYRIYPTACDTTTYLAIAEWEMYLFSPDQLVTKYYPDITPTMTAASVPENWAVTATDYNGGNDPYKAYNHTAGDHNTGWVGANTTAPKYNQIKLASPIAFNRIDMINSTDYPMTNPQDFEIYGSIDGSLYTLLAFFQGVIWSSTSQETKTFRFENNTPYSYCKINCLATKPSNIYAVEINEVYISREERDDGL